MKTTNQPIETVTTRRPKALLAAAPALLLLGIVLAGCHSEPAAPTVEASQAPTVSGKSGTQGGSLAPAGPMPRPAGVSENADHAGGSGSK